MPRSAWSVLIGAGDIGRCGTSGAAATAALVDSVLRADSAANIDGHVFTLGDNAYPDGSDRDFARCFAPTWGDSAKAIMRHIRPAPGNHDRPFEATAPYYRYFGSRAGPAGQGFYSYDVGAWHIIVLNSDVVVNGAYGDARRKAQEDWLRQDVSSSRRKCTLAYWNHPRFTSGRHGDEPRLASLWQILYDGGADVILSGHDHDYERFLPQSPGGAVDSATGITEFVVGTGGGDLRGFRSALAPHSAYHLQGRYGVLKLMLGAAEYRFAFLDVDHTVWDAGEGRCH